MILEAVNSIHQINGEINETDKKLKETSAEFVSILVGMIFKKMEESIPRSDLLKETNEEKWFKEMLIDEYSKSAARDNFSQLTDMVYNSLKGSSSKTMSTSLKKDMLKLNSNPYSRFYSRREK